MTQHESLASEALGQIRSNHTAGWLGAEGFGNLVAVGAVGHSHSLLWGDGRGMARDLAERLRKLGMGPLGYCWRGADWCLVADPADPPIEPWRVVGQVRDVVRTKQHEEAGRPPARRRA